MLFVSEVADSFRHPTELTSNPFDQLELERSTISATTHVDHSARVQTVSKAQDSRMYQLLTKWHHRTKCPALVNTSFNVRGEPIVLSPQDALRCFLQTGMDALVIGNYLLRKKEQPKSILDSALLSSPGENH